MSLQVVNTTTQVAVLGGPLFGTEGYQQALKDSTNVQCSVCTGASDAQNS